MACQPVLLCQRVEGNLSHALEMGIQGRNRAGKVCREKGVGVHSELMQATEWCLKCQRAVGENTGLPEMHKQVSDEPQGCGQDRTQAGQRENFPGSGL